MPDATTTRREVRNPAWCHNMCLLIDGGPQAVPLARHALDGLADRLDRELLFDIHLLVSELVANSVRHGGSEATEKIGLRVDLSSRHVRVEVADGGPGFAGGSPEPEPEATSGRGLFLVERLADRWGVESREETRVWFEIAHRDGGRLPRAAGGEKDRPAFGEPVAWCW